MNAINLLPWRAMRRQALKQKWQRILMGYGVCLVFVFAGVYGLIWFSVERGHTRIAFLNEQLGALTVEARAVDLLLAKKKQILSRLELIRSLQSTRADIVSLFDELVRLVPQGVYFTELSYKEHEIHLHGVTESNAQVSAFMRNIDASPVLYAPNLSHISEKSDSQQLLVFDLVVRHQLPVTGGEHAKL